MVYQFNFQPYQKPFKHPLKTSHGLWEIREGIIMELEDQEENKVSSEIAPLSWFGSETFAEALHFCQQLPSVITPEIILAIPDHLPACQFAFGSALERLTDSHDSRKKINLEEISSPQLFSGLLPSGEGALYTAETLWNQGYRTLKWKITPHLEEELPLFYQLIQQLEQKQEPFFLRLDANGGLNDSQAKKWLQVTDSLSPLIEFIEQPLSPQNFPKMLELSDSYSTPIALDESVAHLHQIQECYHQGWRGIFVIKPSIVGFPFSLRHFCHTTPIDRVFSSVLETPIGRQIALQFALSLQNNSRALGFGVNHWFTDENN